MDNEKLLCFLASDVAISEQRTNDIFLLVEMRILSTRPNGNREGVTEAFIDEIVANPDKYCCLPLYVDVHELRSGHYKSLGHNYDRRTGRFDTTQVGSFLDFKKVEDEYGISLMGIARIPKREVEICAAVMDLYEKNMLNFSFEIRYDPDFVVMQDGVKYVDAAEGNSLTGVAIVSVPAYKESVAVDLIAEEVEQPEAAEDEDADKGVETMTLEEALRLIEEQKAHIAELEAEIARMKEACEEHQEEAANAEDAAAAEEAENEKDQRIQELEQQVEELKAFKEELDAMKAEAEQKALAEKAEKLKAFAEKNGLDVTNEAVAEAIQNLDYQKIAELAMELPPEPEAEPKPEEEEEQPEGEEEPEEGLGIAGIIGSKGMEIKDKYNGILDRR